MYELHSRPDASQGAEYVLAILGSRLPSHSAMVHVHDTAARELVIAAATGPAASTLLYLRCDARDLLVAEAMARGAAVVVAGAGSDGRCRTRRWEILAAFGCPLRSAVCAPVAHDGRLLGAIELVDPAGARAFTDADANVVAYAARQLAEHMSDVGVTFGPPAPAAT